MTTKVLAHFKSVDKILYSIIQKLDIEELRPRVVENYFESLTDQIISQQLSGKVATVIFNRFKKLFNKEEVTPEGILKLSHEELRSVGMSNSKVNFIKDLAQKVMDRQIDLNNLKNLSNEQVIEELTKVKGIGPWTAEMFLMFSLGREDVFSFGDLGLKNALKKIYKLNDPTKDQVLQISNKWSPYRTYACRVLWKSLEFD